MTSSRLLLTAGFVGLVACGGSPPPGPVAPPPPRPAPTLADLTDAMCACKDLACTDKVHADFAALAATPARDEGPQDAALRTSAATCEDRVRGDDEHGTMLRMKVAMCACHDYACVDRVQRDFDGFTKGIDAKYDVHVGPVPDDTMMSIGEAIGQCMSTAMTEKKELVGVDDDAPPAPPTPYVPGGPYHTGVATCDAYLTSFETYLSCAKIPQRTRDEAKKNIEYMMSGWAMLADPNVTAEAKKAASDACTQAIDALRQAASALRCSMDVPSPPQPPAPPARNHPGHGKH